jgi:predicted protein tyrosine phosphatase
MKTILVLSKAQFAELPPDPNAVALRIVNPNTDHVAVSGYCEDLGLKFLDLEEAYGNNLPIQPHHAHAIISFLVLTKDRERFVFHCEYGQSRSHTCAMFFAQEILKDEAIASLLASAQGKSINFAVWNALKNAYLEWNLKEGAVYA